jgi:hypothetical protein
VSISLSEVASNAMLDVLASMMDGGAIELHSDNGKTIAVLKLSNPAARMPLVACSVQKSPKTPHLQGKPRRRASRGWQYFSCDVVMRIRCGDQATTGS